MERDYFEWGALKWAPLRTGDGAPGGGHGGQSRGQQRTGDEVPGEGTIVIKLSSQNLCRCAALRNVKGYFNNHSNNHVGQGLEDNCAALGLQGMCAYKYVMASLPRRAASQETCPMCNPATGCLGTESFGETPGQNGRCMRYPLCRDCNPDTVEHHVRRTAIACPHHARYKPLCRQ